MGLRSRIKAKIKGAIGNVDALVKVIHDEANHPGRPQPHMAAKNPLWGGGDPSEQNSEQQGTTDPEEEAVESQAEVEGKAEEKNEQPNQAEDEFWFLKHDDEEGDDWSRVNPKGHYKGEK